MNIHCALQKRALVTQEKMASPIDFNPSYLNYWSATPRDRVFGAFHDALSSQFSGFSMCHPIYDDIAMMRALRHAIYSAILSTDATATFMFLPCWGGSMSTNPYSILLNAYPHLCYNLGAIPLAKLTYTTPQSWLSQETPLPQHNWSMKIIAVWNTAARRHLNEHNATWLKDLSNAIPEALWNHKTVSNDAILNVRHSGVQPGSSEF